MPQASTYWNVTTHRTYVPKTVDHQFSVSMFSSVFSSSQRITNQEDCTSHHFMFQRLRVTWTHSSASYRLTLISNVKARWLAHITAVADGKKMVFRHVTRLNTDSLKHSVHLLHIVRVAVDLQINIKVRIVSPFLSTFLATCWFPWI